MPEIDDLTAQPIEEIRARRAQAQEVEVGLSYLRRLVHGRLDIVGAELRRRATGGPGADLASLVADLPGILSESDHRAAGPGRLPTLMAPSEESVRALHEELDAVVPAGELTTLAGRSDDEVRAVLDALASFEHDVSTRRREVHARIDALQAELTRRYKSGEASVDALLR